MNNQEAIRLIRNLPTMCEFTDAYGEPIDSDAYYEAVDMAISALQAQDSPKPTAESVQNVQNEDLILRKAAIDAPFKKFDMDTGVTWIPLEYIEQLPSAQPERTCVNCGRTANNGGWYADGKTRCPIEEHYALPKDGYCHLWEKRNVTDDDYPERRTDE